MSDESGTLGFEDALAELERRVRRLESADVPLEEALRLFEEGTELARRCHEQLEAAERRIAALTRVGGGLEERALPEPDDG